MPSPKSKGVKVKKPQSQRLYRWGLPHEKERAFKEDKERRATPKKGLQEETRMPPFPDRPKKPRIDHRKGDRHTTREKKGLRRFGAYLEEELINGIKKVAQERNTSIQHVIRESFQKTIAEHELRNSPTRPTKEPTSPQRANAALPK